MPKKTQFSRHRGERGQTIVLVAISIVSLLAMAALAIDVVTLYVARSEIQRAADAAALAGAKAIADSGITSLTSADLTSNSPDVQNLAVSMGTAAINATVSANPVAGSPPTWLNQPLVISYQPTGTTVDNNPHITVSLQQTNLPTFFARIFGRTGATVTASATAEAYNPANLSSYTPIAPKCVKPWLVANSNPRNAGTPFINTTTGAVNNQVTTLTYDLTADCCAPLASPPGSSFTAGTAQIQYVPAQVVSTGKVCSASCSGTAYEESISCCDMNPYSYSVCGGTGTLQWDTTFNPGSGGTSSASATAAECLIHATSAGTGAGQDSLDHVSWPAAPMKITAGSGPQFGNLVSTSSSIVTIPIVDTASFPLSGGTVTVVGFMQAFVDCVEDNLGTPPNPPCAQPSGTTRTPGDISVTVLNVVGCGNTPGPSAGTPVVGGNGTSAIPVRLITP